MIICEHQGCEELAVYELGDECLCPKHAGMLTQAELIARKDDTCMDDESFDELLDFHFGES